MWNDSLDFLEFCAKPNKSIDQAGRHEILWQGKPATLYTGSCGVNIAAQGTLGGQNPPRELRRIFGIFVMGGLFWGIFFPRKSYFLNSP